MVLLTLLSDVLMHGEITVVDSVPHMLVPASDCGPFQLPIQTMSGKSTVSLNNTHKALALCFLLQPHAYNYRYT